MNHYLYFPKSGKKNRRNGHSEKIIKEEFGQRTCPHVVEIAVPRARCGEFKPVIVKKGQTKVQLCIVHMVCNSLRYISYKDRKAVAADLKKIYGANTESEAEQALVEFGEIWDKQYPTISKSWLSHWQRVIPFFAFPHDIRKAIYTTNAIESMNMTLRKVLKNHRSFPTDESVMKVIFLAVQNISKKWTMPIRNWKSALNRFAIEFEGRFLL